MDSFDVVVLGGGGGEVAKDGIDVVVVVLGGAEVVVVVLGGGDVVVVVGGIDVVVVLDPVADPTPLGEATYSQWLAARSTTVLETANSRDDDLGQLHVGECSEVANTLVAMNILECGTLPTLLRDRVTSDESAGPRR